MTRYRGTNFTNVMWATVDTSRSIQQSAHVHVVLQPQTRPLPLKMFRALPTISSGSFPLFHPHPSCPSCPQHCGTDSAHLLIWSYHTWICGYRFYTFALLDLSFHLLSTLDRVPLPRCVDTFTTSMDPQYVETFGSYIIMPTDISSSPAPDNRVASDVAQRTCEGQLTSVAR